MEKKPWISLCIVSYNKAEILKQTIPEMLQCTSDEFDIIVFDDHSPDHTAKQLSDIQDKRFFIEENETNMGPEYNWMHALASGHGTYSVLINDKEAIRAEYIEKLIEELKKAPDMIFGWIPNQMEDRPSEFFAAGEETLNRFAYWTAVHPSGVIVRTEMMKKLNWKKYLNKNYADIYPYCFMFADIGHLGSSAVFHMPLWDWRFRDSYDLEHQSGHAATTANEPLWSSPAGLYATLIRCSRDLIRQNYSAALRRSIWKRIYQENMNFAIFHYKTSIASDWYCRKYNVACRNIGKMEMFKIGHEFARKYKKWIKNHKSISVEDKQAVYHMIRRTECMNILRILNENGFELIKNRVNR